MGAFSSSQSPQRNKPAKKRSTLDEYPKPIDSEHDQPKAINFSTHIKGTVWIRKFKFPEDDVQHALDEVKTQQNHFGKEGFFSEGSLKGSYSFNQSQLMGSEYGYNNSEQDLLLIPHQSKGILKKYHSQQSSRSSSAKRVKFNLEGMKVHSIDKKINNQKRKKQITMEDLVKQF